jgi:hypothetical protein
MYLEAQPVAQGMSKGVAEAPARDDLPSEGVSCLGRHAGPKMLEGSPLRGLNQFMHGALALVSPAPHHHCSGQIGTVPVYLGPKIEQEQLPSRDRPLAGPGMGQC